MGSKKETVILLTALISAAVIALGAGVWMYFLNTWTSELETANAALQTRVTAAQTKINRLPALRVEREEAQGKLEVAESILPSQEEIENLVDNLSEFAKESGVIIVKSQPVRQGAYRNVKGATKRFEEANFEVELEGDFFSFVEFLNRLENYKRFIRADDFTVAAGRSADEPNSVKLKFTTFSYVDTPAVASRPAVAIKGVAK